MNSTYAQKSSTIQKAADTKATSVLDSSSQGKSLQRKADMVNGVVQRAPKGGTRPDHYFNDLPSFFSGELNALRIKETPAMTTIRVDMNAIRDEYSKISVHPGDDANTGAYTGNMEKARNTYSLLKEVKKSPEKKYELIYNKNALVYFIKLELFQYLCAMINNSWDPDPRMDTSYPDASKKKPNWISSWINYSKKFEKCIVDEIGGFC